MTHWYHPANDEKPTADDAVVEDVVEPEDANLRVLDILQYEVARDAARDPSPPRPDEIDDLAALDAFTEALVKTPSGQGRRGPPRGRP